MWEPESERAVLLVSPHGIERCRTCVYGVHTGSCDRDRAIHVMRCEKPRPKRRKATPSSALLLGSRLSAVMLLRGPHALWGKGWMGDNKVFCEYVCQPNSETETAALLLKQRTLSSSFCADDPVLGQMDPGEPTGRCELVDPAAGVFKRRYSKMTVTLHCDTWMAEFAPSRN